MLTAKNDLQPHVPAPLDAFADGDAVSGKPPRKHMLLRILGGVVALVAALAAAGAAYEAAASLGDAKAYPSDGRLVDIGGYRLHIDCRGQGSPTVVMDSGLGGSSLDWILVQSELAATTQVCVYDRAGMGWSDAGPLPRSPSQIADELHTLLENANLSGPYVLVAHSLAGKSARLLAAAHPEEVAGMVLVDTRSELVDGQISKAEADAFSSALASQGAIYSWARRFGIARLFGASLVSEPLLPPDIAAEMVLLQTRREAIEATTQEGLARSADDGALAISTLGSMPLVVIAAGASMRDIPHWTEAQAALAELSTSGRLVVAERSGHLVQIEAPGIVTDSVRSVLASVRGERWPS